MANIVPDSFKEELFEAVHNFSTPGGNVFRLALYSTVNTYATTFPCAYPNIEMGSEIHPHHLDAHNSAIIDIKKVLNHAISNNSIKYLSKI